MKTKTRTAYQQRNLPKKRKDPYPGRGGGRGVIRNSAAFSKCCAPDRFSPLFVSFYPVANV